MGSLSIIAKYGIGRNMKFKCELSTKGRDVAEKPD